MPILIKNIQASVYDNITDNVTYIKSVTGEIQREDYINLETFIAYLQDLSRAQQTYKLTDPLIYGLKNEKNLTITDLNIDY